MRSWELPESHPRYLPGAVVIGLVLLALFKVQPMWVQEKTNRYDGWAAAHSVIVHTLWAIKHQVRTAVRAEMARPDSPADS